MPFLRHNLPNCFYGLALPVETRHIVPRPQVDLNPGVLSLFLIVLSNPFSDFGNGNANNRIFGRIVVGCATEDSYADRPLFESLSLACERFFDEMPEELRKTPAILEPIGFKNTIQLPSD